MVIFSEPFMWVCNVDECRHPDILQAGFLLGVGKEESLENLPIMKKGKRNIEGH